MTTSQVNYFNLVENKRHNIATERENERSNRAREKLSSGEIALNSARNVETARSNAANESIQNAKLAEQRRSNKAGEAISYDVNRIREMELAERARSTDVGARVNLAALAETAQHNRALEDIQSAYNISSNTLRGKELYETSRANRENESIRRLNALPSFSQANVASNRNTIEQERNELTRRGQNLNLLTDTFRTVTQGLTSLAGSGARLLQKGGF